MIATSEKKDWRSESKLINGNLVVWERSGQSRDALFAEAEELGGCETQSIGSRIVGGRGRSHRARRQGARGSVGAESASGRGCSETDGGHDEVGQGSVSVGEVDCWCGHDDAGGVVADVVPCVRTAADAGCGIGGAVEQAV